ncbi:MAG: hypothetical protein GQ532_00050 [Methylomarinum sp.]|nr:hypothetical protein [Methylomarinum sp.]
MGKSEVEGLSRRGLFRLAKEVGLIHSIDEWMLFHAARNEISHTYDKNTAEEVFEISRNFLPVVKKLLTQLELKND